MIIDKAAREVIKLVDEDLTLIDICICPRYTYAIVKGFKGTAMGVAYTPYEELPYHYWFEEEPRVDSVLDYVSSCNMLHKVIGIAILNAISQYLMRFKGYSTNVVFGLDAVNAVNIGRNDFVVFVGYIAPLIEKVKCRTDQIEVLERNPHLRGYAKPDTLAPRIIPKATILFITGVTLENDTLDYILSLAVNARVKILVGPTAQILPQSLKGYIDYIASIMVENIDKAVKVLKLGGGTKALTKYSVKYVAKP